MYWCLLTLMLIEAHSYVLSNFKNKAIQKGFTSQWIDETTSMVFIKNKEYEIYLYQPEDDDVRTFDENNLVKLYICINCEFADWTRNELFKLIEHLPLLYQSGFIVKHYDIFINYFPQIAEKRCLDIINFIQRFINILMKYVGMYLKTADTSMDTSFLRTLILLLFKIKYIQKIVEDERKIDHSDKLIIHMTLKILNSIQKFTILNCKLSFNYDNKQFFGFFVSDSSEKNIDTFLDDISSLDLESEASCRAKQMTLEDFILEEFDYITWRTTSGVVYVRISCNE